MATWYIRSTFTYRKISKIVIFLPQSLNGNIPRNIFKDLKIKNRSYFLQGMFSNQRRCDSIEFIHNIFEFV